MMQPSGRTYALGLLLIILLWFFGGTFLTQISSYLLPRDGHVWGFVRLHMSFIALLGAAALVSRTMLHTSAVQLLTGTRQTLISKRTLAVLLFWGVLLAAGSLLRLDHITVTIHWSRWFGFLPAVLLLTPLQSITEELVFRAYLGKWCQNAQLGTLTTATISGGIFLALHLVNPEASLYGNDPFLYIYYFLFGFSMMLLGLADRSFVLPAAIHTANNLFTVLCVNYKGTAIPSASLFTAQAPAPFISTLTLIVGTLAVYLLFVKRTQAAD
ncbi:MAG: CPBP family glutamic-type intramembrane protease [Spirochaetota bacterium]